MELEQLRQENEKLQERLNNAAKFFREQKSQIETLTKENEELKRKPKDDYVSPEKWNNLVIEKESLNKQLDEYKLKLQTVETDKENALQLFKEVDKQVGELRQENEQLKAQLEDTKNTLSTVTIVAENEQDYKEKYNELLEKFEAIKVEYDNEVTKTKDLNDILDKVKCDYEQTKIDLLAVQESNLRNGKELTVANEKINEYEQTIKSLELNSKRQLDELSNKLQSKEIEYSELKKISDEDLKRYNELEDNYESLQNKYTDLNNEKANLIERAKNTIQNKENEIKELNEQYELYKQTMVNVYEVCEQKNQEYNELFDAYNKIVEKVTDIISSSFDSYKTDLLDEIKTITKSNDSNQVKEQVETNNTVQQPKPIVNPIRKPNIDNFSITAQPRSLQI